MYRVILIIHILAGSLALLCGLIAIMAKKGGKLHTKAGNIYYISMWAVAISAVVMTLMKFNPFLLAIAFFSLYLTYSGKQSIYYWRLKQACIPKPRDKAHTYIGLVTAFFMIGFPLLQMYQMHAFFVPVLGVFGLILLFLVLADFKTYNDLENFKPRNKKWLLMHIGQMGGAYIATVTAFLLNNFRISPNWVLWLLPTAVGLPLITIANRRWAKKLNVS